MRPAGRLIPWEYAGGEKKHRYSYARAELENPSGEVPTAALSVKARARMAALYRTSRQGADFGADRVIEESCSHAVNRSHREKTGAADRGDRRVLLTFAQRPRMPACSYRCRGPGTSAPALSTRLTGSSGAQASVRFG